MSNVKQLKTNKTSSRKSPKRIMRPCEYGLINSVKNLVSQLGTVEAYNKLCDEAEKLKRNIDNGEAKQANELFATNPKYIYPLAQQPNNKP